MKAALQRLLIASFVALLFMRSTAGSFWGAPNRFYLHWQRWDAVGVLLAILVIGALLTAGWCIAGYCGSVGRWLRQALFVFFTLQYARVNVAESLIAAGWDAGWLLHGLRGIHVLLLILFFVKRQILVAAMRNACLLFSPILLVYALTLFPARIYQQKNANRSGLAALEQMRATARVETNNRTVVLVVFDEWQQSRVFGFAEVLPDYPELARVAENGIVFANAYSPAAETLVSLPAILAGQNGTARIDRTGTLIFSTADSEMPFEEYSTIFSDFKTRGHETVMIGNYLPYADLIGHAADICVAFDLYRILGDSPSALAAGLILENVRMRLSFIHPAIGWPYNLYKHRYFVEMADTINSITLSLVEQSAPPPLIFVHHSIPHMPFIFERDGPRDALHHSATLDLADYEGNLRYTDSFIGELFDAVQTNGEREILLILTADHGFREDPMWRGMDRAQAQLGRRHVPLVIYESGMQEKSIVHEKFELVQLREIITNWIDTGELIIDPANGSAKQ